MLALCLRFICNAINIDARAWELCRKLFLFAIELSNFFLFTSRLDKSWAKQIRFCLPGWDFLQIFRLWATQKRFRTKHLHIKQLANWLENKFLEKVSFFHAWALSELAFEEKDDSINQLLLGEFMFRQKKG